MRDDARSFLRGYGARTGDGGGGCTRREQEVAEGQSANGQEGIATRRVPAIASAPPPRSAHAADVVLVHDFLMAEDIVQELQATDAHHDPGHGGPGPSFQGV